MHAHKAATVCLKGAVKQLAFTGPGFGVRLLRFADYTSLILAFQNLNNGAQVRFCHRSITVGQHWKQGVVPLRNILIGLIRRLL